MSVSQTRRKFGHYEKIVPGLTDRIDNRFANAEARSIGHVRVDFVHGSCRQDNIGIGRICRELPVDADKKSRPLRVSLQTVGSGQEVIIDGAQIIRERT